MGSYPPDEHVPPQPAACSLSFATPQVGQGYQSLKKNHSTSISGDKRNTAVAKPSWPEIGEEDDEEEDANIQDGTYDQDIDFFLRWVPAKKSGRPGNLFWADTGTDIYVRRIGMCVAYPLLTKYYIKNIYIHTGLYVLGLRCM